MRILEHAINDMGKAPKRWRLVDNSREFFARASRAASTINKGRFLALVTSEDKLSAEVLMRGMKYAVTALECLKLLGKADVENNCRSGLCGR